MKRNCDICGEPYEADERNLKRGWGLCCSKRCAASKREKSRPSYNIDTVKYNNLKRAGLLPYPEHLNKYPYSYDGADDDQWGDCDFGIHD